MKNYTLIIFSLLFLETVSSGQNADNNTRDPNFFPIAVWLQNPSNAADYKANGINMYVGM
jgi:hypothetical protein